MVLVAIEIGVLGLRKSSTPLLLADTLKLGNDKTATSHCSFASCNSHASSGKIMGCP